MLIQKQVELHPHDLLKTDIYQAMGYRENVPDDTVCVLVDEVLTDISSFCAPLYMYQIQEARQISNQRIQIGNLEFAVGGIIGSYLSGVSHVCLFVATAGKGYEAYLKQVKEQSDIIKEYVIDSIGSVIAETCVTLIEQELDMECDLHRTLPYSPGYCGWNICEQQKLFSFFPLQPCGIILSDSYLMSPIKSVSGFFGLGKELTPQPYRCGICNNKNCYKSKEK